MAARCDQLAGQVVNIAYGRMVTISEVARSIAKLCQRNDLGPTYLEQRPGDVYRLQADVRRARDVLGYQAEVDFEQGLEKYLAWFGDTYPDPSELLEETPINWQMPGQIS
jgi:UDP-glucose 4-epimerase